ncbi:MAG: EscU/YscU/HrcU family type III secretion system export apparatus switch protein [Ferrimicrobium sp.]
MPRNEGTEQATPKRQQKARKDGMVARSSELATWILVLLISFVAPIMFNFIEPRIVSFASEAFGGSSSRLTSTYALRRLDAGLSLVAEVAVVAASAIATIAFLVTIAQVGFRFVPSKLTPKFSHLSPRGNLKRIFSGGPAVEVVKAIIKLTIVIGIAVEVLSSRVEVMISAGLSPIVIAQQTVAASMMVLRLAGFFGLALGFFDLGRQRKHLKKQIMMTRQEIKDEHRESDGDPQTRSRRRRLAREMSRRRMLADVSSADVIVVNPTHFAVALRYDPTRAGAPIVVAKGADYIALTIRERGRAAGVPIVVDPPLARVLHASTEVSESIPPSLFLVVARLLAFVYQLSVTARYFDANHTTDRSELPSDLLEPAL